MISSSERRPRELPMSTAPSSVTRSRARRPRVAAPESSPPTEAWSHSSQKIEQRASASRSISAFPCASAPSAAMCWPGRRSPAWITGSSPGVTVTTTSCAAASSRVAGAPAELGRECRCGLGALVEADPRSVAGRRETARRPRAVDAGADHADGARPLPREHLGGDRGGGAGAERGHGGAVDHGLERARLRARGEQCPAHHRQTAGGVVRERGHPLEDRQAATAGRHRTEIAVRRGVEINLRRHLPLARRVALERLPRALDRRLGGNGGEDRVGVEDRDLCHAQIHTLPR